MTANMFETRYTRFVISVVICGDLAGCHGLRYSWLVYVTQLVRYALPVIINGVMLRQLSCMVGALNINKHE